MNAADSQAGGVAGGVVRDAAPSGDRPDGAVGVDVAGSSARTDQVRGVDQDPRQLAPLTSLSSLLGGTIEGGDSCSADGHCD